MSQDDLAAQWRYGQGKSAHVCDAGMRHTRLRLPGETFGANGEFRTQIPEGDYRVSWSALPPGYFIKTITAGSTDLLASPLKVVAGSPPPQIVVTLGVSSPPPWVKVSGRVTGSAGSSPAARPLRIGHVGASTIEPLEVSVNPDGTFSFPMVLP